MEPITTICLNPALDLSSVVDRVMPTHKMRTRDDTFDAGGGGINVARVITELGGNATSVFLGGGVAGSLICELLDRAGGPHRMIRTGEATRVNHVIFEVETGREYRFVAAGARPTDAELEAALAAVRSVSGGYLVASGSLPPGTPTDILARIAAIAAERGARFVLDTSGAALEATLAAGSVYLVKPSLGELEALAGRELATAAEREAAARDLVRRGAAELVAVSLGPDGALLVSREGVVHVAAPQVEARSAVGAGDSFVGAMALALAGGESPHEALRRGIAAGSAAVLTPGTRLCRRADYERLLAQIPARA